MVKKFYGRIILTSIMMFLFSSTFTYAQKYESMWKAVEAATLDGQPNKASVLAQKIVAKAEKEGDFVQMFRAQMTIVECHSAVDPASFKEDIADMEERYGNRENPVEQAMVHALLASAYEQLARSNYNKYDRETRDELEKKKVNHYQHVLDNMGVLADANANDYVPLTTIEKDGSFYNHDMLSVLVKFVTESDLSQFRDDKTREGIFRKAAQVYAQKGNKIGEAFMLLNVRSLTKEELHELLMRNLDTDAGMDIAVEYLSRFDEEKYIQGSNAQQIEDEQLKFIHWVEKNVKKSSGWASVQNEEKRLTQGKVRVAQKTNAMPGKDFNLTVTYRNEKKLKIEVHKYVGEDKSRNSSYYFRTDGPLVTTKELTLGNDDENQKRLADNLPTYGEVSTVLNLPAGHYVVIAKSENAEDAGELNITTMSVILLSHDANTTAVHVLDEMTGRPVSGVKVQGSDYMKRKTHETVTNNQGVAFFNKKEYSRFTAIRNEDDQAMNDNGSSFNIYNPAKESVNVSVFTDRSLYRPGQEVNITIFLTKQISDDVRAQEKVAVSAELYGVGNKLVECSDAVTQGTTNEYGTANFRFKLPKDAAVGNYQIQIRYDIDGKKRETRERGFRVEEYKRPTFDVTFSDSEKDAPTYVLGPANPPVVSYAKYFTGNPVQGGKVTYTVDWNFGSRWYWSPYDWKNLSEGETTTDDEGKISIPINLTADVMARNKGVGKIALRVRTTVTDASGESHEAELTFPISKQEYLLEIEANEMLDVDTRNTFLIRAQNMQRKDVNVKGIYQIAKADKVVYSGGFVSNTPIVLPKTISFGEYSVSAYSISSKGDTIKAVPQQMFVYRSKTPAVNIHSLGVKPVKASETEALSHDYARVESNFFSEKEPAHIYFAPQYDDAYTYYYIYSGNSLVDSCQAVFDAKSFHNITIPYRKEYGDGITVVMFYVRNGHAFKLSEQFKYVEPDKSLTLSWSTFRDKVQPGSHEQWVLNVKDSNGKTVSGAEMMAVMYDASLDRIYNHNWYYKIKYPRSVTNVEANYRLFGDMLKLDANAKIKFNNINVYSFDYLNPYRYRMLYGQRREKLLSAAAPMKSMATRSYTADATESVDKPMEEDMETVKVGFANARHSAKMDADATSSNSVEVDNAVTGADFSKASVRSNFSETAFFMPNLITDINGDAHISFTLPESLTEWKFMAFAHTKDVHYGLFTDKVIARKEFMVRPNMPRFVRWGDKVVIASSIVNQDDKAISGAVRMRLLKPGTDEVVHTAERPFSVDAGKTTAVSFDFVASDKYDGLDCEIIAVSGSTSDGEKNYLPVLSTKREVVENAPFYIIGEGDKSVDLQSLFNKNSATATNKAMTVEYTDNPAWMCIEALRSVNKVNSDDAISNASALYSNTRIADLMLTFPILAQYDNADTLRAQAARSIKQLTQLQKADGGWSWFAGMNGSRYVTLSVCQVLAKMPKPTAEVTNMLNRGMAFLDSLELEDYKYCIKKKQPLVVGESNMAYLYLSSFFPERSVSADILKMRNAYLSLAEKKLRDLTMYGLANTAYTLNAFSRTKSAQKFVESLKDNLASAPGQGKFYATDAAYYSWMDYRIPTQTAAMRAIRALNPDDEVLNDMQLWLLTQKQTQHWDNPMNTIDVVDLLLAISPMETFHETKLPAIKLDGKPVENLHYGTINTKRDSLDNRPARLTLQGNMIADIPSEQLQNGVTSLTVQKQTPSISWGTAQATFYEDVKSLSPYATDQLRISQKQYVIRNGEWVALTDADELHVGDQLRIRNIITADRDMDFVHVSAQQPACLESKRTLSGYQWMGDRGCYLSIHDSSYDLFFDWFTRGTTTIDMDFYVTRSGEYQHGIATVECEYAKQFGGHTGGNTMVVK